MIYDAFKWKIEGNTAFGKDNGHDSIVPYSIGSRLPSRYIVSLLSASNKRNFVWRTPQKQLKSRLDSPGVASLLRKK